MQGANLVGILHSKVVEAGFKDKVDAFLIGIWDSGEIPQKGSMVAQR